MDQSQSNLNPQDAMQPELRNKEIIKSYAESEVKTRPSTRIDIYDPKTGTWKWWDLYPALGSDEGPNPEHVEILSIALTDKGPGYWNDWRKAHPSEKPNLAGLRFLTKTLNGKITGMWLRDLDLSEANLQGVQLHFARLENLRMNNANLRQSLIMQAQIFKCSFIGADMTQACLGVTSNFYSRFDEADMSRAFLFNTQNNNCIFINAILENAELSVSQFQSCDFRFARLKAATCEESKFFKCNFGASNLQHVSLVGSELNSCNLSHANVYAINAWDVSVTGNTSQTDLTITKAGEHGEVTVDDLRVAQFIHLIINNNNLREVISTMGNKGILILGRFSDERKPLLNSLKSELRDRGYIPIIFDFERPEEKDFTETIITLAGLCLFIIADITSPKSVPLELQATIPNLMLPLVTILREDEQPFSMFKDLWNKYDWVFEPLVYDNPENLISVIDAAIIQPALQKHKIIIEKKARELGKRHVKDFLQQKK